ncbi:hypothetical protein S40288_02174 [Stachybotrys chartarum IBT 40288]|nr:hypothetical protein S40288_02174 [Stachybotrys chartarum IBT 40288]
MPEPEAQLQATADLSPVSPSPVHTTATLAVPALQETVDTIDAMVAAALAPNGMADEPSTVVDASIIDGENDGVVDDDSSFDDAYGEDNPTVGVDARPEQQQLDVNDDYAKTFDSPIEPEEGEDPQHDVSSLSQESNNLSHALGSLPAQPSDASHAAPDPSPVPQVASGTPAAQSKADQRHPMSASSSTPQPSELPQQEVQAQPVPSQPTITPQPAAADVAGAQESPPSIEQLVADLTSQAVESAQDPSVQSAQAASTASSTPPPNNALPSSSSLPPRPPLPHSAAQSYASQHHPSGSNAPMPAGVAMPSAPGQPPTYIAAGAPGTSTEAISSLPTISANGLNASVSIASLNPPSYPTNAPAYGDERAQDTDYQRQWEQFMSDERQYMAEAKWDRFPEGSRIFIGTRSATGAAKNGAHIFCTGNLSSDKVSKRDVFDMFHRFGRLAQISLKSAYGFVQYHTVEEGHRAMENLQGIEIRGRRIHLEISRVQDKSKKERPRSPDRGGRGRDGGRRGDRHNQQNRDDYRPARKQSPRRNDYPGRDDGYSGRDRGYYEGDRRGRSQSPGYRRNDKDSYRRRSPSPYSRARNSNNNKNSTELDLPRRYGADVPDVQIILQPEVDRDFVAWVEGAFKSRGLKTEVMYLHPRFPKDQVIQRQAAEGVHAVVDLDIRAQSSGRIPVQAFDRSAGSSNVRFDQYVDLDPNTAAEVILRTKASGAASYTQAYPGSGGYPPSYAAQGPQHHATPVYPGSHQPSSFAPQQPQVNTQDIASILGQVDNTTLQRLLSTIQTTPQAGYQTAGHNAAVSGNPQVDIQSILSSLNVNAGPQQGAAPQAGYGMTYGGNPAAHGAGLGLGSGGTGDAAAAAQVQNIMAQLARFRQ